jgi:ketosteroid isomerase-like protein
MTAPTKTKGSTSQEEILGYEQQFWDAIKAADAAAIERLTADEFTFVMNQGVSNFGKRDFAAMLTDGSFKMHSYRIDRGGVTFREFAPGVAFLAYKVNEDFELNGKREQIDSYYSSTWLRSGDTWRCAVATESRA